MRGIDALGAQWCGCIFTFHYTHLKLALLLNKTALSLIALVLDCINQADATKYPREVLETFNPSGVPPHILVLKEHVPIIVMRNLDPPKICNGTRLQIKKLHAHVIEAVIIAGDHKGEEFFIPRIPLIPTGLGFDFKRIQFPVQVCYAMTINKSQG